MTRPLVAGVDGSARSLVAADWAAGEAALRGVPLLLVLAVPPGDGRDAEVPPPDDGYDALEDAVSRLSARHHGLEIAYEHRTGTPSEALTEEPAELLVLGTRGAGGFPGLLLGSTAVAAAGRATGPVALVPTGHSPERYDPAGDVVLGIDARSPDDEAMAFAFDAAHRRGARLRAVHAWRLPAAFAGWMPYAVPEEDRGAWEDAEEQALSGALRSWREKYPEVNVLPDVRLFSPAKALVTGSGQAGLLVLCRRGERLGPTADAVVHHARCPVVLVPRG